MTYAISDLHGRVDLYREILEKIDSYIAEPGLGTKSGATGALLLAKQALQEI